LLDGRLACQRCCFAVGVCYRRDHMSPSRRAELVAPRLRAMLSSPTPLMKNGGNSNGRVARRARLEAHLILCEQRIRRTRAEGSTDENAEDVGA
jgi:hypothetical protein